MSERSAISRLRALAEAYRPRLEGQLGELRESLAREDLSEVRGQAHRIRGSAGSYGFAEVSEACAGVEEALRKHLEEGAEAPDIERLKGVVESLLEGLARGAAPEEEADGGILLIAAEAADRDRLATLLRASGRRVTPVDSGREAALSLFERSFQALLLAEDDRRIHARVVLPALFEIVGALPPTLVLLQEEDPEHKRQALELGAVVLLPSELASELASELGPELGPELGARLEAALLASLGRAEGGSE